MKTVNPLTKGRISDKGPKGWTPLKDAVYLQKEEYTGRVYGKMKDLLTKIPKYLSLFFVSAYVLGLAVYLFRFFAVTTWSEYGIGILTVGLSGFALGGVCLSLLENFFRRYRQTILFWLPFVLLFVSALAFQLICQNRFNPLLLQKGNLWAGQVVQILFFYLALIPVFFLSGLYIGLSFLDLSEDSAQACAFHLLGLAAGLLLVIFFQSFLHPFYLLAALFPVLALAALCRFFVLRYAMFLTALILLLFVTGFGAWRIIDGNQAHIPDYKTLASAMRVPGNTVAAEIFARDGYYRLLDNVTERRQIDLSKQDGLPKIPDRPPARGLYRDGDRLTGLYKGGQTDRAYFNASVEAFPYLLKPTGTYLLIGTDGGFKIHETWGENRVIRAVEPVRTVYELVRKEIAGMMGITMTCQSPLAVLEPKRFDLIDMSADFLKSADANRYGVTVEALSRYFVSLRETGILSLPVETAGFPGYGIKMLVTVKLSLQRSGVKEPGRHVMVYRSAPGARILVSRRGFTQKDIAALKTFCRDRFLDASWYPGIAPAEAGVLHRLPVDMSAVNGDAVPDALQEAALTLFRAPGTAGVDSRLKLEPATLDRPFFYAVYPLSDIRVFLARLSVIPRAEMGHFVNLAVLLQVLMIGAFVMLIPLIGRKGVTSGRSLLATAVYFACLGLGFVLSTIALIDRCTFFVGDGPGAAAAVMTGMLVFSGFGSYSASKYDPLSDKGVKWAVLRIMLCLVLYVFLLIPVLSLLIPLSPMIKIVISLFITAPAAYTMGLPLALGLMSLRERTDYLLPWALGIYGISGVISLPLAMLIAVAWGIHLLFFIAVFLYFVAIWAYPGGGPGVRKIITKA